MLATRLKAFATLGKICRGFDVDFAENSITDRTVLGEVQDLLEQEIGRLDRLFDVSFDTDTETFQGKAQQRISGVRSQIYSFQLSPDRMVYRLTNADEVVKFTEDDNTWIEILDYAAKSTTTKKLNCKPGNIQCGGKCQNGKLNCYHGMTPAQKKAAQAAANKAQATAVKTPKTPKTKTQKTAPAPTAAPATPDGVVKTNQPELDKSRADLVSRFGAKTVEDAEKNVQRVLNDADLFIRVGQSSTLEQILGDRFKTAHELNRTDHQIPHLQDDYLTARARVEAKTLGYDEKGTDPADRPIYAYLGGKDLNGASHANVATAYGSIAVKLRPEVKDRTTFTGADSFKSGIASEVKNDGTPPPPNAASLVSTTRHGFDRDNLPSHYPDYFNDDSGDGVQLREAARAKNIDALAPKLAQTGNAYVEAQVHGQVTPKDIAEIHFSPSGIADRPTPAIAQFAKDNGVDLYVGGRKLGTDELDAIANPPADRRTQRVKDLADALEKGDFNRVADLADTLADDAAKVDPNPGERDLTLKLLRQEAGYSELPTVGTPQDVTSAWKQGGVLMVRGDEDVDDSMTGADILKQFQTGDFHTGNGVYGNGTYVGHAGKFVNGQYVGYDPKTERADAKRAVSDVAKHDYINGKTTITRMALQPGSVVVAQSSLLSERSKLSDAIEGWADPQRSAITAGARVFTQKDENTFNRKVSQEQNKFSATNPRINVLSSRQSNGGMGTREQLEMEFDRTNGGAPLKVNVERVRTKGSSRTGFVVRDDQGNTIATIWQSGNRKDPNLSTSQDLIEAVAQHRVLKASGRSAPPKAGELNDPAKQQQLEAFNARVTRVREALGVDESSEGGSVERFAILRGVDAIALDDSYEPDTFMNLLNRSRVIVQQDPLSWSQASKTGAL